MSPRSPIAIALLAALTSGCAPIATSTHFVDTPVSERTEESFTGDWTHAMRAHRLPGKTVLAVERYRPCEVILTRTVDRTAVTVKRSPPFIGAYWFVGATLTGLGAAVAGISLARNGPGDAGDVVAGATVGGAGLAALGVAGAYGVVARDRRAHVGPTELSSATPARCARGPSPGARMELLDASGTVTATGVADAEGRWYLADEAPGAATAVAASVEGGPAIDPGELSGLRCSAEARTALDAFLAEADRALAPELAPVRHTLASGEGLPAVEAGGEVHLFAVSLAAEPAVLETEPADTSIATLRLAEIAAPRGLVVSGRTRKVDPGAAWPVRVRAAGCWLLSAYEKR